MKREALTPTVMKEHYLHVVPLQANDPPVSTEMMNW